MGGNQGTGKSSPPPNHHHGQGVGMGGGAGAQWQLSLGPDITPGPSRCSGNKSYGGGQPVRTSGADRPALPSGNESRKRAAKGVGGLAELSRARTQASGH